jgi:hypothetical protein
MPIDALVDSGAAVTLFPLRIARYLGVDEAELDAGPRCLVHGVGGRPIAGRGLRLALALGPGGQLVLQDAVVYFVDSLGGGFQAILGQEDVLHRLEFNHRNQLPTPEFVLRLPG